MECVYEHFWMGRWEIMFLKSNWFLFDSIFTFITRFANEYIV